VGPRVIANHTVATASDVGLMSINPWRFLFRNRKRLDRAAATGSHWPRKLVEQLKKKFTSNGTKRERRCFAGRGVSGQYKGCLNES
jgi:hypothetical protein